MDVRLRSEHKLTNGKTVQNFYEPGEYTALLAIIKSEAETNKNIVVTQLWMEIAVRESMDQEEKRWDETVMIYERAYPFRVGREA